MKNIVVGIILTSFTLAQQGKYIRKSVSSLESVWYKPGSLSGLNFDAKSFDKFIDYYIETPRFDYNILPKNLLQDFRKKANSLNEVTIDALSGVIEETITNKIIEILNDPEIMKNRGNALKSESAFQSFAAKKAKSVGLTTEELATLMNSAYMYLPFISSVKKESDGPKDLSITIEGGIIWWQMKVSGNGSILVEKVLSATTNGFSSIDPTSKVNNKSLYNEFTFGAEKWETTPDQYCQNSAALAFCKNLGVKTKEIDDFKLSAQIIEVRGKKYGFPLGFREGVHLDDGFHIAEFEEKNGKEVLVKKGFVRVSKTGNNKKDPNSYTYGKQLLGERVSEGTLVLEHPRLGIDARFKLGFVTGLNISKDYVPAGDPFDFDTKNLFEEDVESGAALDLYFSYNLAPIIGLSQTFLDLNTTFAFPLAKFNDQLEELPTVVPFLISAYLGATKKLWLGSSNISLFGGSGLESLNIAGDLLGYDYVYSVGSLSFKFSGDYEKLITPDISVNLGLQYKYALAPMQLSITWGDFFEGTYEGTEVMELYPDLSLSALGVNLGVNYALGELPFDLFGFLDPFKKY